MRFIVSLLVLLPSSVPAQEPINRADVKRSLIFTASDGGDAAFQFTQLSPSVGLTLNPGESVHPQSVNGGQTFTWTGTINILQASQYTFSAQLLGQLEVRVGERVVLAGQSQGDLLQGQPVALPNGYQPFLVKLTRTAPGVRLDLLWKGPGYQTEPIPYFFFGHLLKQQPANFLASFSREHGRLLVEEHSCVKCHTVDTGDAVAKTLAERSGPNLSEIGKRVYPGWLDAWLANPHELRPNTVMPKMFSDDDRGTAERYAVVAYLSSLGGPMPNAKNPSLQQYSKSVNDGQKLYLTAGCAACHGDKVTQPPTKKKLDDEEDEKPEAKPEELAYSLGTASSKGYYRLGHVGSKTNSEALSKYLQNPLATNPHGRMPNMQLNPTEATDLARFLVQHKNDQINPDMPAPPKLKPSQVLSVDGLEKLPAAQQWRRVGQELLTTKGCVNCHTVEEKGKQLPVLTGLPKLAKLGGSSKACLSGQPGPHPRFKFDDRETQAIQAFLQGGLSGAGKAAPAYSAKVALRRFNCLNCHNRDGEGGFTPELAEQMRLLEKAENADDVAPPRLTGVGHKLRTSWFREVLVHAGRARPWMTLRMPQYGPHQVGFLAEAMPLTEGTLPQEAVDKVDLTPAKIDAGRTLTGKNGHGCISCHDISGVRGGGTRGPDLALTQNRVRYDWFRRWMHQPQRLAPGTRMPQVILDGKSLLTSVLNGDGDAQIEALWAYYSLGPGLPLPSGMEPPKGLVIQVKDRPEILRTFMPDNAGTKAIAVGYPGGVNLVFDAASCRLGYAWSGNFLDASPVWNNRGGAPAILLGPKFWQAPLGFPWAVTDPKSVPDFSKRQQDPAYGFQLPEDRLYNGPRYVQFEGYKLDAAGAPSFHYKLRDDSGAKLLTVTEKPGPLPVTIAGGLKREFQLEYPANKTAWLNVGSAAQPRVFDPNSKPTTINSPTVLPVSGTLLVLPHSGKATVAEVVSAPDGAAWQAVAVSGGWQMLVKLPARSETAKAELVLKLWGLPRDEDQLILSLKKE